MSEIRVHTDSPYTVHVGHGEIARIEAEIPSSTRVALLFAPDLSEAAESLSAEKDWLLIRLPDGELAKTPAVLADCWRALAEAGFTRNDMIISLGGGATTDLAGFVAATWLRGIRIVHVPTSLLAMVDAAIGGKTGINTSAGKNLVGAFHHPAAVICDLDFLSTLPLVELRQGMAEIIKCGFISDPMILNLSLAAADSFDHNSNRLPELIERAVAVKAAVVAEDFKESKPGGLGREILNYGHTLGHAIEKDSGFAISHGHAISIGMVFVAELARLQGLLNVAEVQVHRELLAKYGLPTSYDSARWPQLRDAMAIDKKSRGIQLRFIALAGLQNPVVIAGPSEQLLEAAFAAISE